MLSDLWKCSTLALCLTATLVACGSDGATPVDASVDHTSDAPPPDAASNDAAPAKDSSADDAGDDATTPDDAGDDAPEDAEVDAPILLDGGGCLTNADCTSKQFCQKADGDCNGIGWCTVVPQVCPYYVQPLCGCDDKTYNNKCFAQKARTNVQHAGACN